MQSITVALDTDGNAATPQTNVTFTFNGTNQISWTGGFPAGSPMTGDTLTLNASRGFTHGSLTFNFANGEYTYFTGGVAGEGDSFNVSYIARDGEGDITPSTTLAFSVVDGQPVARPDIDTLFANQTSYSGNVISGMSTDGGLAVGSLTTDFTAQGSGADNDVDGARVTLDRVPGPDLQPDGQFVGLRRSAAATRSPAASWCGRMPATAAACASTATARTSTRRPRPRRRARRRPGRPPSR